MKTLWDGPNYSISYSSNSVSTAHETRHVSITRSELLTLFMKRYTVQAPTLIQGDTKKRELLKTPTKIEEIQEKKNVTEIEPLQLAF